MEVSATEIHVCNHLAKEVAGRMFALIFLLE